MVVVDVDHETQIQRLIARNGLSRARPTARIAAQASSRGPRWPPPMSCWTTTGTWTDLREQIAALCGTN